MRNVATEHCRKFAFHSIEWQQIFSASQPSLIEYIIITYEYRSTYFLVELENIVHLSSIRLLWTGPVACLKYLAPFSTFHEQASAASSASKIVFFIHKVHAHIPTVAEAAGGGRGRQRTKSNAIKKKTKMKTENENKMCNRIN